MNPLDRIWTVARVTLLESFRQKVLNLLFVFGLLVIVGANFFSQFTFDQQFKFIKDLSLGIMTLTGIIMALVAVAQLLPAEFESRTIFTILSKPVRRWEFLIGKYLGVALLLGFLLLVMCAVFAGVLAYKEQELIADARGVASAQGISVEERSQAAEVIQKIHREAFDPRLVQAVLLIYAKVLLVAAVALLLSTFATSVMFTVVVGAFLYIIGHLQSTAREVWLDPQGNPSFITKLFLSFLSFMVPDLNAFNLVDDIVAGNAVDWPHTLQVLGYAVGYMGVILLAACAIFESKEI